MVSKVSEGKRVPSTTAWRRRHGLPTKAQQAERQRYLNKEENETLISSIKTQLQATGYIHTSEVRTLATEIKRCRPRYGTASRQTEAPGKNWATKFLKAHCNKLKLKFSAGLGWNVVNVDFEANSLDVAQLCLECISLKIQLENALPRPPNRSRKLHTFQNLSTKIEDTTCKLCRFVLLCAKSWNWPATDEYLLHIHDMDRISGPTTAGSKVLFSITIKDNSREYQGWVCPMPLSGDVTKTIGSAWGHLGTAVDLDKIKDWLQFCDAHHLTDCRMREIDDIPYFWLIDCATRFIVDAPDQAKYIALSYCWGSYKPPLDNPDRLPAETALVVEDALKVARGLGVPYLWVDR
jgi:hypothetical protein